MSLGMELWQLKTEKMNLSLMHVGQMTLGLSDTESNNIMTFITHYNFFFLRCEEKCSKSYPPIDRGCLTFQESDTYKQMTSDEKKKGMIVKIGTRYKLCYYQKEDFGWCNIKQVPSMKDTSKPNWGYCSYHLSV